jgi:hypothetical protein
MVLDNGFAGGGAMVDDHDRSIPRAYRTDKLPCGRFAEILARQLHDNRRRLHEYGEAANRRRALGVPGNRRVRDASPDGYYRSDRDLRAGDSDRLERLDGRERMERLGRVHETQRRRMLSRDGAIR